MARFKLRAESDADVLELIRFAAEHVQNFNIQYIDEPTLACIATFESKLSLKQVKDVIANVPDGHVMLETVALANKFTGERV